MKLIDKYGRIHNYLRISITDRCNFNCFYCNPSSIEKKYNNKNALLSYDEIYRLASIFVNKLEINKIRITGGEPFARKNINELFSQLYSLKKENLFELTITTNGSLLNGNLNKLINSGLDRINFSLDSLKPEKYFHITGKNELENVLNSIEEANRLHFKTKINTVVIRNYNDDEIFDFVDFAKNKNLELRFIEYMPFSSNGYDKNNFISSDEIRRIILQKYSLKKINQHNSCVTREYFIEKLNLNIGFISAISEHFCSDCNRLRITATGKFKLCLFSRKENEIDLKDLLRNNFTDGEIAKIIKNEMQNKELTHPVFDELVALKNNNIISIGG